MPILRHTSPTLVPPSACCNANAICCSVNFDFFIGQASLPIASLAGNSHSEWSNFLGEDHDLACLCDDSSGLRRGAGQVAQRRSPVRIKGGGGEREPAEPRVGSIEVVVAAPGLEDG